MNFQGSGVRIDDYDIPVLDVEAAGSGFDRFGRLKMLFEPHIFYRNLNGEKRSRALSEGLAYPVWRAGQYPADSYPRLMKAMEIDETAALKACSWGLPQILGENHKLAGYKDVQTMVSSFCADEANQLEAMVRFIKSAGLDAYLRRHDWRNFARGYNGAQYERHGYHIKLANAFAKWKQIKDTPFPPPPDVETIPPPPRELSWLDRLLNAIGAQRRKG
jgi:hypothetical protein